MADPMLGRVMAVVTLAGALLLAGCTFGPLSVPASDRNADDPDMVRDEETGFLTGFLTGRPEELPDAVPVTTMREAALERGYGGVIVRVTGVAPTQGYYNAALVPQNEGAPDAAGLVTLSLVAIPPDGPEAIGPERTRLLMTAAYSPTLALRDVRGFRVVAGPNSTTLPLR